MSKDEKNARNLLIALERRGAKLALVNWSQFVILTFWLPCRLKRRVKKLEAVILVELQNAALRMAEAGKLREVVTQESGAPKAQVTVN